MPPPTLRGRSKTGLSVFEAAKTQSHRIEMIPVAEAIQIVRQHTQALPAEKVKLETALGRVLAEDVVSDTDLPPFDRAQMEG